MAVSDYSTTAASNTLISGINIAEGCAPAGINNAIRQMMADIATASRGSWPLYIPTVGGTADVITLTSGVSVGSYTTGMSLAFIASGANTTNVTVNLDSLGAKAVTKRGTTALASNDILSAQLILIQYDGTRFQLQSMRQVRTSDMENNQVTNAILADMAQSTIKGRAVSAGTGDPTDLTATQATAILDAFTGDSGSGGVKGLVPAPSSGDAAANKFLKANGSWTALSTSGTLLAIQTFTSSGSYTKATNSPTFIIVDVLAGGGGGGANNSTSNTNGGGGGGSGEYARAKILASALSASETVTIGAAGNNPANGTSNGGTGGTSSFGSFVTCTGGTGGNYATNASGPLGGAGGTGGSTSSATEIIRIKGTPGGAGIEYSAGTGLGGNGGSGPWGGGGLGSRGVTGAAGQDNSGSGGAGIGANATAGTVTGGKGLIVVYEYA